MLTLRPARHTDADTLWQLPINAIRAQCMSHYPAELMMAWTDGSPSERFATLAAQHFQLAELNGQIVASGMLDLPNGQLDAVFVHPDAMGRGIGRAMVEHLENQARDAGLIHLRLDSTLNAAPFYRKLGFVGDAISQYHSPRGFTLDCIPMQKDLL